LIAVLVGTVAVLAVQNFRLQDAVEATQLSADNLTAEIENIEHQVDEYKYALEAQDLDIEKKQAMLSERDSLIADKNSKIADLLSRNKISQLEAERLRARVETLEWHVKDYQKKIDGLKAEIALKDAQIDTLKDIIRGTKDTLQKVMDDVIIKDVKLKGAAKLSAHSFEFFRYKQSGSPVKETEFRASQLDRLRICMAIAENTSKNPGELVVYVQIHDPAGNIVRDEAKSGFFKYNGRNDVPYSAMTRIKWEKQAIDFCLDFDQPKGYKYADGTYTIKAFCDIFEIGKSTFSVH
jgi:chaperonin cofactor prefoldin